MYGHRLLEVFERHLFERPDLDDARVVDEHVHAAEMARHHLDEFPDLRAVGHVAREGEGARPAPFEVTSRALKLRRVARADGDVRALFGELAREHKPQSARAARDEHGLAAQVVLQPSPVESAHRQQRARARGSQRQSLLASTLHL